MNNVRHKSDFKNKQAEFAAFIRDPINNPCPADVKRQRMATYRELFFNNVDSFLSSNFPVLRKILDDRQWFELAQDFFSSHACRSPYFSEIPEEFLDFLQNERNNPDDYPFLLELAHYEWVEMALSIAQDHIEPPESGFDENLLQCHIALSPLAWPLAYQFPVQQISPQFLPEQPPEQPTYLVVYRDYDDEVHFLQINAMTYSLLQQIQQSNGVLTDALLTRFSQELGHPNPVAVMEGGLQILREMAAKGIIVPRRD